MENKKKEHLAVDKGAIRGGAGKVMVVGHGGASKRVLDAMMQTENNMKKTGTVKL